MTFRSDPVDDDMRRIVKGLVRLGYLSPLDSYAPCERRNEKLLAACEKVLDRKVERFMDLTEAEMSEVASVVGGTYHPPKKWGLLTRK